MRLNLEPGETWRLIGSASVSLLLDTVDFSVEHPDQEWLAQLQVSCSFDHAAGPVVSPELGERISTSPDSSFSAFSLGDATLYVQTALEPQTFQAILRFVELHIGSDEVGIEVTCGLTGYYDETDSRSKTLRDVLSRRETYVSPVSVAMLAKGWSY